MFTTEALEQSEPGLLGQIQSAIRRHSLNLRTEQNYLHWITRFVLFHQPKTSADLELVDQQLFLAHLRDRMALSRARLNQAARAIAFFFADVLQQEAAVVDAV